MCLVREMQVKGTLKYNFDQLYSLLALFSLRNHHNLVA